MATSDYLYWAENIVMYQFLEFGFYQNIDFKSNNFYILSYKND
tara:strand:- start:151 stop:279 length:129 start_codon:yes stop_codon:yes gene_type:complete